MTFLVVDDSPTMRRIIVNALRQVGYDDIVQAEGGNAAMEALTGHQIDFVITDWNMPGMNGLDLTKSVRNNAATCDMPVLMVTTRGMEEDVLTAMQAQVSNYIVKPFTPDILQKKIDRILSAKQTVDSD